MIKLKVLSLLLFSLIKPQSNYEVFLPIVFGEPLKAGYAGGGARPTITSPLGVTWYHRWWVEPIDHSSNPVRFEQHFGCEITVTGDMFALLEQLPPDFNDFLLFMNEPDLTSQCYHTPAEAVEIYKQVLLVTPHAKIVGPQPSHRDYYNNWAWLTEWYDLVEEQNLPMPKVASIHWYADEVPVDITNSLFELLSEYEGAPKTVWFTEWGTADNQAMVNTINFFQNESRITRYAWYDITGNYGEWSKLVNNDGTLTFKGQLWASAHGLD